MAKDKEGNKKKSEFKAPRMWDTDNFNPPRSAYADSYHEMLSRQMEETIAAVVAAENFPDTAGYEKKKKEEKGEDKDK